ncbi:MAG: hypothetical protein AAF639_04010 [Chloroflexota bacterium]
MKAFTVMGRILKAVYEDLFLCVFLSLIWWLGTVLILPAGPVTLAMNHVANRVANYKRVDTGFFWQEARQNIGRSWLIFALTLLAPLAVIFNIWFYMQGEASWMRVIGIAWVWILLLILLLLQYVLPLYWQQDEPNIRLIARNSLLLTLRYPLYSFLMFVFQVVMLLISIGLTLPLILLAPALLAFSANFSLVGVLQEMDLAPEPPQIPAR